MRLDGYRLVPVHYPWMNALTPFAGWDVSCATQSLRWYDAYNSVKHNRETEFSSATLENVFDAVAACQILHLAQGGLPQGLMFFNVEFPPFSLTDCYFSHPMSDDVWTTTNYPFGSSSVATDTTP